MVSDFRPQNPDIDKNMWSQIDKIITANRGIPGSVITVLRECQNVVGYMPVELISYISQGLNLPDSTVFGVATFYALFSLQPKGRHTIKVCKGTACYVKGIKEVIRRICDEYQVEEDGISEDRRFSLEVVRCVGACGLAPVAMVDQDIHGGVSSDKITDILEDYH
jgi:NADH:ubiquinone oxidoreductase subunit E